MIEKPTAKILFVFLVTGAFLFTALGGYMDMMNQSRIGLMSKEHLWNDGLFMLTAAAMLLFVMFKS